MFRKLLRILETPPAQDPQQACPAAHAASELERAAGAADSGAAPADGGEDALRRRVIDAIAAFRPFIQADAGDVEFVEITPRRVVRVRLRGACVGCPSSVLTLQMGLERMLREQVPEINAVESI